MIKIDSTPESIESKGGLLLAGKIAGKAGLGKILSTKIKKAGAIITSLLGILVEGKSDFESIGEKRGSLFFQQALGLPCVYAKETLRLYLQQMAQEAGGIIDQLRQSAAKIIRMGELHGLWIGGRKYLPVDIDTTVLDNSKTRKEGVSWTYQGCEGYQPIFAYVGKEGYMLDCELRPGSQHCQKGTAAFIKGLAERLRSLQKNGRFLFRLDSGNDAFETLQAVTGEKGYYCIIKRNKRQENEEQWLEQAKRKGTRVESRKGKKVWIGVMQNHPCKKGQSLEDVKIVFEVIERTSDREGNQYLIPEIQLNSWWTNLDCEAGKVIELYHNHATSEQFHAELKHDMGVERLPSGKLAVNKIMLAVAMNAYNTLRLLGQRAIEQPGVKGCRRKRLGKVIQDVICVAGKLVKHAGALVFKLYEKDPILPVFLRLNAALDYP